jgi:heparan-alpha-glucosaminide N-acetyltransferase
MSSDRISSIDIMRGLTLLLMLFVNDLNMDVAPAWLGHMKADFDGMGLADWVFPGFLFMVGMAIPYSFSKRISQGMTLAENSRHIFIRTISLLIIGVLMLNTGRVNQELTGISENLWALMMYVGVFLVWNDYVNKDKKFFTITGLRLAGMGILVILVLKFRSGQPVNEGSLITGWWGILGLIGWGYLVTAFTYQFCRESILRTASVTLFFLLLNILSGLKLLEFLNPVKPLLGVIIEGNVPFIVLTGLTAGLLLRKTTRSGHNMVLLTFSALAAVCLVSGFFLRSWFIISKIKATPSWGLVCSGISFFVFTLIYLVTDVWKKKEWASFFKPAGENSLTTYLAPDILYYLIWMSGLPLLVYKQSEYPIVVVAGSIVWAILMVWLTAFLKRLGISLKL